MLQFLLGTPGSKERPVSPRLVPHLATVRVRRAAERGEALLLPRRLQKRGCPSHWETLPGHWCTQREARTGCHLDAG